MPRNSLIERYYDRLKEEGELDGLSESDVHDIIHDTFKYFKNKMANSNLPDVRLKGFGSFQIFAAPILNAIKKNKKKEEPNNEILLMLENYVKNNAKLFEKVNQRRNNPD